MKSLPGILQTVLSCVPVKLHRCYSYSKTKQEIDYVEKKTMRIEPGQSPNCENQARFTPLSYMISHVLTFDSIQGIFGK